MIRAREPDETGFVDRDGVQIYWERLGEGERTVVFLPPWSIVHSRQWKFQLPYFARHFLSSRAVLSQKTNIFGKESARVRRVGSMGRLTLSDG